MLPFQKSHSTELQSFRDASLFILTRSHFSLLLERGEGGGGQRGREEEREKERSTGCLVIQALTGDRTHSLGLCPDGESNQ